MLGWAEQLVLVGAKPPVSFFAYPGKPSWGLPEGCTIHHLAQAHEDGTRALEALAEALGADAEPAHVAPLKLPEGTAGKLDQFTIGQAIARHLPEGAAVFLENLLAGRTLGEAAASALEAFASFDIAAGIAGMIEAGVFTSVISGEA